MSESSGAKAGPATGRELKGKLLDSLDHDLNLQARVSGKEWRGLSRLTGPRFQLADADIQRMESITHRFSEEILAALEQAVVIDTEAPTAKPRSSFLRVVADNSAD
jgi:hypothetical protein